MMNSFVDEIVDSCLSLYEKLPKTGKPIKNEWTVLSCIVQFDQDCKVHDVVSIGTGSKCIGSSKMSPMGNIINDSHAEVIARRCFIGYLYENILKATEKKQSIFTKEGDKFKLKSNIEFIFYSSQLPCGDASIMRKADPDDFGEQIISAKRQAKVDACDTENKKQKPDIYRTGAKCLPNTNLTDPKEPGENYHVLSQVRTKPGRGERTLSVSCSDKIARWIHVGIQGALLDLLLTEPIYIKHFIFGAGVPYCEQALNRALLFRSCDIPINKRISCVPKFYQSTKAFSCIKSNNNVRPAHASIIWYKGKNTTEVAVHGRKLGETKKNEKSLTKSLCISKYCLYKKFHLVLLKNRGLLQSICGEVSLQKIDYMYMKKKALRYQENWSNTKNDFFKIWTKKPEMWNFCLSDDT